MRMSAVSRLLRIRMILILIVQPKESSREGHHLTKGNQHGAVDNSQRGNCKSRHEKSDACGREEYCKTELLMPLGSYRLCHRDRYSLNASKQGHAFSHSCGSMTPLWFRSGLRSLCPTI